LANQKFIRDTVFLGGLNKRSLVMIVNSDINILGGLHEFELIFKFINKESTTSQTEEPSFPDNSFFTKIKTDKSVKRFGRAIRRTLLSYKNDKIKCLVLNMLENEGISDNSLLILFWNASINNELLNYLNAQVYFPAYYSGRLVIRQDEVLACIKELKTKSETLQKLSNKTIEILATKYLTLLRKFKLLEGSNTKTIKHPYLSDLSFIYFFYWIMAVESKSNVFESSWLIYSFNEKDILLERLLQKKYTKFIDLTYTGDRLTLIPIVDYKKLYYVITKSGSPHT